MRKKGEYSEKTMNISSYREAGLFGFVTVDQFLMGI
jgi:hypothetical protein